MLEDNSLYSVTDYKFNFTLANCCLSLLNRDREILVVTVTQLLTSVEIQPLLSAFKVSARAESFVIEGVSAEGDLVPLITVDNVLTGMLTGILNRLKVTSSLFVQFSNLFLQGMYRLTSWQ